MLNWIRAFFGISKPVPPGWEKFAGATRAPDRRQPVGSIDEARWLRELRRTGWRPSPRWSARG